MGVEVIRLDDDSLDFRRFVPAVVALPSCQTLNRSRALPLASAVAFEGTTMSCFVLPGEHIGFLVDLGMTLEITIVLTPQGYRRLDLGTDAGRFVLGAELMATNRASASARYSALEEQADDAVCSGSGRKVALGELNDVVQALQWVRCYEYQSDNPPNWVEGFACSYAAALRAELESRIISFFDTTWVLERSEVAASST